MGEPAIETVLVTWPWDADDELLAPLRAQFPDVRFVYHPFYGRYTFLKEGSSDTFDATTLPLWVRRWTVAASYTIIIPTFTAAAIAGALYRRELSLPDHDAALGDEAPA